MPDPRWTSDVLNDLVAKAESNRVFLNRDPQDWWDDEHCLDNGQAAFTIDQLVAAVRALRDAELLPAALDIIRRLTDPDDPCWYDHHGYCQAHGWLTDGVCAHKRAKDLLDSTGADDA